MPPAAATIDSIVSRYRTQKPSLPHPNAEHWDWQRHGACRGLDTTIFFPPTGTRGPALQAHERKAKAICRGCPVRTRCQQHALDAGEPYGIWGGTTAKERALQRQTL
ncbi:MULTISPECIES: WhiB family transcriptional regulator [Actinomycetes]|uniref:WhiB family transcriptional regulator n=1 Tax=Actinomycetes TaxID=1760 RepID=UPI0009E071C7|nr:WhiB family transcriptional regulator [Microbispora sp. NRRL B-24597]